MIKEKREAGLCIADDFLSAAECRERRRALVAMQIDDEIVALFAQAMGKTQDAEETSVTPLLVDQQTRIDVLILLHNVREDPIREECDARCGIVVPQCAQHGCHEHKITEMHEVDDENILVQNHCPSSVSPCSMSCHESVRRIAMRSFKRSRAAVSSPVTAPGRSSVRVPPTSPMTSRVRK